MQMGILKREGVSVAPQSLPSSDKKPSARIKELIGKLPPEAKEQVTHILSALEDVERVEKYAAGNTDTIERLKQTITDLESGDQNLITAMQKRLERQEEEAAIERRVFLLTVARVKVWDLTREEAEHLASI